MLVVEMKHSSSDQANVAVVSNEAEAAQRGRDFAERYGFEIRHKDGEPALWDMGNDDGAEGGYEVFSNVIWGKTPDGEAGLLRFMHYGGSGPCLRTIVPEE